MSAWQIKRRKVTGNTAKHHRALMRQQLDLRTINNMQWHPFRNMKEALKREVIIVGNINRKRVLLQCPFGGYEWYLGDHCWAQLEYCAVPYDPPEKLHCFPSFDVVRSLRAAGWIEAQHYIVGHHIDYDAYWRHVSMVHSCRYCEGIEVEWEDEAGTSQAGTSRGRGSRGWTSDGGAASPRRSRRSRGSFV
ncbi:hypothetical protein GIB67_035670 [Kingdonia uniflora]|uniref:Uncharacterized protein n=1 Tax=Kingdonia uniflora TaxID=39325 RepID=A0A7J7LM62_9MAGN|nr:hypothetical protein GIB67_035670 [Kingdonia uniflora]